LSALTLLLTLPEPRSPSHPAFRSTVRRAAWAPLVLPLFGWLAAATVVQLGAALVRRVPRSMAVLCVFAGVAVQGANRMVKVSELPDLHAGATLATIALVYLGLRFWVGLAAPPRGWIPWVLRTLALGAVFANFGAVARHGLDDHDARRLVADQGMDARGLVRVARRFVDVDRDGYASIFGGPDCNDWDQRRNPAAREEPGAADDLDCDGVVSPTPEPVVTPPPERQIDPRIAALVERTRGRDVILVTIDALRADVMVDTAEHRAEFPNFFALHDQSVVFTRAFAPAAGTDLSVSSLVTGRIDAFAPGLPTLAERLTAAGYDGRAILPSEVLRYAGTALLTRGFADHHRVVNDLEERDVGTISSAARTTLRAFEQLDAEAPKGPVVLWLHYFDVHEHHELDDEAFR
jgi:hypothetical protein